MKATGRRKKAGKMKYNNQENVQNVDGKWRIPPTHSRSMNKNKALQFALS